MGLLRKVGTVSGWTMVSRITGLLRDRLLGGVFGASATLDAFMLAFSLPNLLRNLFGEGALSAAFVPRYVRARAEHADQAEHFAGLVLTRLAAFLALIAALGMILAGYLALYADQRTALVAALAFAQIPYAIFICVAAVQAGMLQARGHFAIPAAAPVLLNLCLIGAVMLFPTITALPYAVLVAGILQLAFHCVGLLISGGVPKVAWRTDERLRDLRKAWVPTVMGSGVQQLNVFLDGVIAYVMLSHRPGAVSVLYFANRLLQLPVALISSSIGTAIYPELSRAANEGWPQAGQVLRRGTGILATLLLPSALGLWLCAEPLVRTIYQTGAFSELDAQRTVLVTQFYALALLPVAFNKLLVRALHAGLDHRSPMHIALIAVAVNLCLNVILVQTTLYEAGLALASVISGSLACALAGLKLRRYGCGALVAWKPLLRPLIATLMMALAVWALSQSWALAASQPTWLHALRLGVLVATGALVYALTLGRAGLRQIRA